MLNIYFTLSTNKCSVRSRRTCVSCATYSYKCGAWSKWSCMASPTGTRCPTLDRNVASCVDHKTAARHARRHTLPPHLSAGRDTPCAQCEWVAYTRPSERTFMRSTSSKEHATNPPWRPGRASGCWTARDRAKSGRCTNEQFPDVFSVEIVWTIKTGYRLDTV